MKKISQKLICLIISIITVFCLVGCGNVAAKNNETAKEAPKTKTYTDMAGRQVTLSEDIKK